MPTKPEPMDSKRRSTTLDRKSIPKQLLAMVDGAFGHGITKEATSKLLHDIRHSPQLYNFMMESELICKFAEDLVTTPEPHKAHCILRLAYKLGARFKQNVYERVVFRLAEAKHWHLVSQIVSLGQRQTGKTTVRLMNWRARSLVETRHFTLLRGTLGEFSAAGLVPNRRTYHIILQGHLRNHDVGHARSCMQAMEAAGVPIDSSTHAAIISACRGMGSNEEVVERAFEALKDVGTQTANVILNSLMRLCLDKNDLNGALHVLQIFDQRKVSPIPNPEAEEDSTVQNGKLSQHHHTGEQHVTLSGSRSSPAPDVATFTMLIDFLARKRDMPSVLRVLARMRTARVVPDGGVAAALIRAHFVHGSDEMAMNVVAEICKGYPIPRVLLQRLGLSVDANGNQIKDTMPSCGPFDGGPTVEVFNALLRGALEARGIAAMPDVLRIMQATSVAPDAGTLNVFMSYLEKQRHTRPRDLIRILRRLSSLKIQPNLWHLRHILHSVLRRERAAVRGVGWNNLSARLNRHTNEDKSHLQRVGISPSFDPTAGLALSSHISHSRLIKPIIKSLSTRGMLSDRETIALRMKHEAVTKANVASAQEVFQTMIKRGMHPSPHHYAALMEGYAELGDMRGARAMLQRAEANKIKSNVVMHTIIIVGHARMGRPDLAMRAFEGMLRAGIQPDFAAIDAVVSAFFAVKAFRLARQTLIDLWPLVAPFPEELRGASLETLARTLRAMRAAKVPVQRGPIAEVQRTAFRRKIGKIITLWESMDPCATSRPRRKQTAQAAKVVHTATLVHKKINTA